jgi:hypothetical protein
VARQKRKKIQGVQMHTPTDPNVNGLYTCLDEEERFAVIWNGDDRALAPIVARGALNELMDARTRRRADARQHVPGAALELRGDAARRPRGVRRGAPVVASDAGGTSELVHDGQSRFLYRCRSNDGLRRARQAALDPVRAGAVVHGGAELARRLTPEASAAATARVLTEARGPGQSNVMRVQ